MSAKFLNNPARLFPALAGLWLLFTVGYRLRPDNVHQYFLLSLADPTNYPPLPWLSTPLHPWFLCPPGMDPLWFLALLQILCCGLTGWGALRLLKGMGLGASSALLATGIWAAVGACGHDSSMAFLKGYVTPASVAGTALIWGAAFLVEGRTVMALVSLFLSGAAHMGFAPLALLLGAFRLAQDSKSNTITRGAFPVFIAMAVGLSALGLDSWEAYALERSRFRHDPESVSELMTSLSGIKFLCELAWLGLLALKNPRSWGGLPAILFSLALLGIVVPGFWPLLRATPLLELLVLGSVCLQIPLPPVAATVCMVLIAAWQGASARAQLLAGASLGPRPLEASQPMMDYIRQRTGPEATFVIPPHFTSFRSHAARRPYVDIAATPWTQAEREFWDKRLRDVYGPGPMTHEALYATDWDTRLTWAWNTGAEFLLWPSHLIPEGAVPGALVHQDATWALIDLSKVGTR